jgi:L-amino acid N-acyltransferase YncA
VRTAVRRATADDAEAIADVHIETWRVAYRGQLPDAFLERLHERRTARAAGWLAQIASTSSHVFIAERDGHVVGFVSVGPPVGETPAETGAGELYAI